MPAAECGLVRQRRQLLFDGDGHLGQDGRISTGHSGESPIAGPPVIRVWVLSLRGLINRPLTPNLSGWPPRVGHRSSPNFHATPDMLQSDRRGEVSCLTKPFTTAPFTTVPFTTAWTPLLVLSPPR